MATSLTNTGVTFPDGTSQTNAGTLSNAASGWMKFPNGMILQWGRTAQTGGSNGSGAYLTTSYPIAFPNACWQVVATTYAPTELNVSMSNNIISLGNSSFVVLTQRQGGANPRAQTTFLAWGY